MISLCSTIVCKSNRLLLIDTSYNLAKILTTVWYAGYEERVNNCCYTLRAKLGDYWE